MEEEFELVPMNPIRKLEKRLEHVEKNATSQELLEELMAIVRTNQQVVDNMTKTNSAMINKIIDLSNTVDKLVRKVDALIESIELQPEKQEEEKNTESVGRLEERLSKMEKRVNSVLLSSLARKPLVKRPMAV